MPNQLSSSKRRKSIAEHSAVLDALEEIARIEGTSVAELLRTAARQTVRFYTKDDTHASSIRSIVLKHEPKAPKTFKSAAHVARYKRELRNFDVLRQELNLSSSQEIQKRNSLAKSRPKLLSGL